MGTSPLHSWETPDGSQAPQVHLDMENLAAQIDADVPVVCTSTTRPAHKPGRKIYETNTKREYVSDGTTWMKTYDPADIVRVQRATRAAGATGEDSYTHTADIVAVSLNTAPAGEYMVVGIAQIAAPSLASGASKAAELVLDFPTGNDIRMRADVVNFTQTYTIVAPYTWGGGSGQILMKHDTVDTSVVCTLANTGISLTAYYLGV